MPHGHRLIKRVGRKQQRPKAHCGQQHVAHNPGPKESAAQQHRRLHPNHRREAVEPAKGRQRAQKGQEASQAVLAPVVGVAAPIKALGHQRMNCLVGVEVRGRGDAEVRGKQPNAHRDHGQRERGPPPRRDPNGIHKRAA